MDTCMFLRNYVLPTLVTLGLTGCPVGCGQKNDTNQVQDQATVTPASTEQDQSTQGSQVNIYFQNRPGGGSEGNSSGVQVGDLNATVKATSSSPSGNQTEGVSATYSQAGNTVVVTTGGTTPTATGSSTATGSGTQNGTQTNTPTQDVSAGVSIPVGLALNGGVVDQMANALGGPGSLDGISKEGRQDLANAFAKGVKENDLSTFFELFESLRKVPTSQPN